MLLPWTRRLRDWKVLGGQRVLTHWEAVWHQPEGGFAYVRMDLVQVRTE